MMTKNLKNKVLLSVFAGAMVFSCAASAAEIEIDGTDFPDNVSGAEDVREWAEKNNLKYEMNELLGSRNIILANEDSKIKLTNFKDDDVIFSNVGYVDDCESLETVIGKSDFEAQNADELSNNTITVDYSNCAYVYGAYSKKYDTTNNTVKIKDQSVVTLVNGAFSTKSSNGNRVEIINSVVGEVAGGNAFVTADNNTIYIENAQVGNVVGAYLINVQSQSASNNKIIITKDSMVGMVTCVYSSADINENNSIDIIGENNLENSYLLGWRGEDYDAWKYSGTALNFDGFNGKIANVSRFENLNFKNLDLNKLEVVTINNTYGGLENTKIDIISFAGGQNFEVGKTVDLLKVENKDSWDKSFTNLNKQTTTNAGVAQVITSDIAKDEAKQTITATIKGVELADQTMLVAKNRAVAAAFINQGTDLIADSLDTLSRDGKYGVKTFAAVHGNRSKYDVNSDIKINGWSTIVGVGSETEHNGGDFSWGVFYENGSGNYRTFNSFNNEYFRGDGSLVYNGGGIAARYENAHGVYTEGSLRAGMLKSDMDNALSDGENKYGYSSESEYYGAHIGIGQIIPLTESSDLDVYGKFFHTYTEGDSFKVDTDEFEFDGINSDRLRVGARFTTNKENKFSTYYGLAYEYEFNGDAEMRAAGLSAPTQSLQGSSYMAEVGFNYQPTPESPWSFDLNMRGYAGEREGATFNVQATYTF